MRSAIRSNRARQAVSYTQSIPAPVNGWDATNPISEIEESRAYQLDNWVPRPGYVEMRRGYTEWSKAFSAPVETLLVWRGPSAEKMFAASGTSIANVTVESSTTATVAVSSTVNARWQYVNVSTAGGHFIVAVNGAVDPRQYDGTTWSIATMTGTGLTAANLIHVMAHQNRLHFIEKSTLNIWYLDTVEAIKGAASKFPLGAIFSKGGYLVAQGSWSVDGGQGQDDLAVYVTSEGEAAIYQGTDPGDANAWALVGVYEIGVPLGPRAIIKWGSDLAVVTTNGVVPLSSILVADRTKQQKAALTARIQNAYAVAAQRALNSFGWEAVSYPAGNLVIVNVPWQAGSSYRQYVMNAITGAWCRWLGINALTWAVYNDEIYFGGLTRVCRADRGSSDAGEAITADLTGAYLYYGARGALKQFKMLRPVFETNRAIVPALEMAVDFQNIDPVAQPSLAASNASQWGTAQWGTAKWGSANQISANWTGVSGLGIAGAVRARVVTQGGTARQAVNSTIKLISFDVAYERGGVL
jgi:hypothetical protein